MVGAEQRSQQRGAGNEGQPRHAAVRTPQEAVSQCSGAADSAAQTHSRPVRGSDTDAVPHSRLH